MVKAEKIRAGFYRLAGVTHSAPDRDGYVCGGQIFAENFRHQGWECFCEQCKDCDINGWDTLRECIKFTPEYWMA